MPNVGDIIRASDIAVPKGIVAPFYNVTLSGRYPIFWGDTEANTGWLVCDGGSDLHGGNVPNLINKFIMGTNTVSGANKTGGSTTTSSSTIGGNVGSTTLTTSTMPSHSHTYKDYYGYSGGDLLTYGRGGGERAWYSPSRTGTSNATGGSQSHTHSLSSTSHTHTITPPYYTLIFCVKLP